MRHKQFNQAGSMSMLTVIFLALLLTVITVSFVRLAVTEQRASIDDDLTSRAFYAAESGIEDGRRALAQWLDETMTDAELNGDDCGPPTPSGYNNVLEDSGILEVEYTCQLINLAPGDFLDDLNLWETTQVPLRATTSTFNAIDIEWHIAGSANDGDYVARGDSDLIPFNQWQTDEFPAMLRAAVFYHLSAVDINRELITYKEWYINPLAGPLSPPNTRSVTSADGEVVNGGCESSVTDGAYACKIRLTNFGGISAGNDIYLRLQALYRATNVKVSFAQISPTSQPLFEDVQASIDVTGRAGDVYRRVEARVSLLPDSYPFPDYAIWSNSEICKDIIVTDDAADYTNTCGWGP